MTTWTSVLQVHVQHADIFIAVQAKYDHVGAYLASYIGCTQKVRAVICIPFRFSLARLNITKCYTCIINRNDIHLKAERNHMLYS